MRSLTSTILFALILGSALGQNISSDAKEIKKELQGLWVVSTDHKFTITFLGDSAMQYYIGDEEMSLAPYQLTKEGHGLDPAKTGYFIVLEGGDGEKPLILPLESINGSVMKIQFGDRVLKMEKRL